MQLNEMDRRTGEVYRCLLVSSLQETKKDFQRLYTRQRETTLPLRCGPKQTGALQVLSSPTEAALSKQVLHRAT